MSGINQNPYPYPQCIKCGNELNPQDSRGWEQINKGNEAPITFWLCPNCIANFQHTKDLLSLKDSQRKKEIKDLSDFHSPITNGVMKIYSEINKLNKYLNKINEEARG